MGGKGEWFDVIGVVAYDDGFVKSGRSWAELLSGMGGILAWFGSLWALRTDAGACTEGMVLAVGHIFTSLELELSTGLTPRFVLSSSTISNFSALSPFVSQPKPLHLGI